MKEYLSNKINDLPASATLTMAAKAREMKNEGVDIIGLSLGEPDFNIPEFIKDAAIDAINDNYNSYTPVDGYLDLKQSISNKFKSHFALLIDCSFLFMPKQTLSQTFK